MWGHWCACSLSCLRDSRGHCPFIPDDLSAAVPYYGRSETSGLHFPPYVGFWKVVVACLKIGFSPCDRWFKFIIQSTLSKADTLGTKATVRFRECPLRECPLRESWLYFILVFRRLVVQGLARHRGNTLFCRAVTILFVCVCGVLFVLLFYFYLFIFLGGWGGGKEEGRADGGLFHFYSGVNVNRVYCSHLAAVSVGATPCAPPQGVATTKTAARRLVLLGWFRYDQHGPFISRSLAEQAKETEWRALCSSQREMVFVYSVIRIPEWNSPHSPNTMHP